MHTYKIWQAPDGYWKTKLPAETGGKCTRLIKKKHKTDLEEEVVHYYELTNPLRSYKHYFKLWTERQQKCGRSDNSIYKYQTEYKRFFEGYPIEDMDVNNIDEEVLMEHLANVVQEKNIRWKALKGVFCNIRGVFNKAIRDRIIIENPCDYVDLPLLQKLCYNPPMKQPKERILSPKEMEILLNKIHHPKAKNVNPVTGFAIEFAMYTGMRVGEIAALAWEDINFDDGIITICKSEKKNRLTNEVYVSTTKNGKFRLFPITTEIQDLLQRIEEYEKENGYYGEYVFQDKNGRISKNMIGSAMRRKTDTDEFYNTKSIHAIRRTINSNLKCNGVSTTVASSLLGHTERVNDNNYTYDIKDMDQKRRMVEEYAGYLVTK